MWVTSNDLHPCINELSCTQLAPRANKKLVNPTRRRHFLTVLISVFSFFTNPILEEELSDQEKECWKTVISIFFQCANVQKVMMGCMQHVCVCFGRGYFEWNEVSLKGTDNQNTYMCFGQKKHFRPTSTLLRCEYTCTWIWMLIVELTTFSENWWHVRVKSATTKFLNQVFFEWNPFFPLFSAESIVSQLTQCFPSFVVFIFNHVAAPVTTSHKHMYLWSLFMHDHNNSWLWQSVFISSAPKGSNCTGKV